jgi:hypothetical protein
MYTIKITYDTGDSESHKCDQCENIDLEWADIEKAKHALQDIKDHYRFYIIDNLETDMSSGEIAKCIQDVKIKPWYFKYGTSTISFLLLENDKGERVQERIFWIGYFETFKSAEIILGGQLMSFEAHDLRGW